MKEIMEFSLTEQETSIAFLRGDEEIEVYSSDRTVITKLSKITNDIEILTENERGAITSAKFKIKANQILFRKEPTKRTLSEEDIQRRTYNLQKARANNDN